MTADRPRKISTPIVLVACSAMISIGVAAFFGTREGGPERVAPSRTEVRIDRSSPERVAEAFLDAWRKRRFDAARAMSRGHALEQVERRADASEHLSTEERQIEGMWDKLAAERLDLRLNEAEVIENKRVLRGIAEGSFLGRPYRRRMEFTVQQIGDEWFVEDMISGEILEGALLTGSDKHAP